MTGRQGRGQGNNNPRQNEYFVPRDGIDREVITADICRYLGNDALVRPGNYHDDNSGRTILGYYITAYRNLTTAMIDDLKNDSARWEQERRKHQSGAVRYQDSAIHRMGGSSQSAYGAPSAGYASGSRDNYGTEAQPPSYPGSDAPGYSASSRQNAAAAAAYGQSGYATSQPYSTAGAPYPPATEVRYATGTGTAGLGAGGLPGYSTPLAQMPYTDPVPYNVRQAESYHSMEDAPPAVGSARATSGYGAAGARASFPATTLAPTSAPYSYTATAGTNSSGYAPHPVDNFYGRGGFPSTSPAAPFSDSVANTAAGVGYSPGPEQPSYDDQSPVPRGSATSPGAQAQGGRHERERERGERDRDRDRRERDSRKPHHYGR